MISVGNRDHNTLFWCGSNEGYTLAEASYG